MCFDSDEYQYETRVEIRNGERQFVKIYHPRHGMARRRRYGFGGPYYPSRYYARPPSGRYINRGLAYLDRYPNVPLPRDFVRDAYPRYYSGYGHGMGYHVGGRAAMPIHYSMVGFFHFPFPLIALPIAFSPSHRCFSPLPLVRMKNCTLLPSSSGVGFCSWVPFVRWVSHIALHLDSFLASPHCNPSIAAYPTSSPRHHRNLQRLNHFPNYHVPTTTMESYPKPRHQYIYTPRYGQRGILSYVGQAPNGAAPTGVISGAYTYGVGYAVAAACQPMVYNTRPFYGPTYLYPYYSPGYTYYNSNLYGSLYPLANFNFTSQRSYYNTVPTCNYTAHVYPLGPTTTTTTTYHVTNAQAPLYASPTAQLLRETRPAYAHGHAYAPQPASRKEIQLENRRIATQRGSYDARKIRPADAHDDDPFWCREVNGEWHLRSYYQIENECHPGRWMMDAEIGFLVFHRA